MMNAQKSSELECCFFPQNGGIPIPNHIRLIRWFLFFGWPKNLEQNVMALRCGKFGDLRWKQMPNYVKTLEAKAPKMNPGSYMKNIIQWCAMWAMYILDFFQHWYHEGSQRLGTYNSGWKYGDLGVFFLLVALGRKKKRSRCAAKTRNCDSRCSERRLVLMSGCFFWYYRGPCEVIGSFCWDSFWQLLTT